MSAYADTSFLFSLYVPDANSARAARFLARNPEPLVFSPLQQFELRNAIRLAVFRKQITALQRAVAFDRIAQDLLGGTLTRISPDLSPVFAQAESLSSQDTEALGVRGMDMLHVASALELRATDFFTFDARQRDLAKRAGLKVRP